MKSRSILVSLVIILVLCSVLFVSFYDQAKREAVKNINNEQLLHARQAARGIEDFFHNWTDILTAFAAANPVINMDKTGKEEIDLLFRANQDKLRAITRVDAEGRIIYTIPFNRDAIGRSIAHQDHIREIMRTHKPVISDVFSAVQGYDAVALHVPVFSKDTYRGSLAVAIDFQALAKRYLENIKIGNTGYAWMTSRGGTELYCPVPGHTGKSVFENCKDFPSILVMAADMLKGRSGLATYSFDKIRGDEVEIVKKNAVYMPINLGNTFWSIVVATSEDEIIASLKAFRNKLFIVIGLLVLGGTLFSYYGLKSWFIVREEGKRRSAEAALRESESKLSNIIEFLPDATFVIDLEGKVIAWNRAIEEMTGIGKADMLGQGDNAYTVPFYGERRQHLLDLIDLDDQELAAKYHNIRRQGNTLHAEAFTHALYGGRGAYVFAAVTPLFDAQGNRVGAIESIRDITEKREAERALLESEEKYRLLFENAGEGIMIVQEKVIRFANPAVMLILEYPEDQIIGRPFLPFVHPQDREAVIERHQRRIRGEEVETDYSFRVLTARNKEKWVHINARAISWEGANATLNFFWDITARVRAEEERQEMERQLRQAQKLESIGTLAGGIAHDFNNLLMGIQGFTSLMLLDLDPAHPHYERLRRIEEQVQSGADLTRQLLGFARGGRYEVKPTNINEIIIKTSAMFARTRKEISVHPRLSEDIWTVEVDRGQMGQVFMNLFVNAWQAMPGGGEIRVETENDLFGEERALPKGITAGRYVRIKVTDTGMGMDPQTRERIFDPFFTTKGMGRGFGLGLATVYGIIKGHGGTITVESEPDQGTTFSLYLPASEAEAVKLETVAETIVKGAETVLVVDDEPTVLTVNKALLESLGYRVHIAGSGQEAIAVYMEKGREIDLVVLDMIMPGMSGGDTFDRLRELNPDVRVLLASGYSLDGPAHEILDRGCRGFLQKPFRLAGLSRKVREILTE